MFHRVKGFAGNVCEMQLKDKEQTRKNMLSDPQILEKMFLQLIGLLTHSPK